MLDTCGKGTGRRRLITQKSKRNQLLGGRPRSLPHAQRSPRDAPIREGFLFLSSPSNHLKPRCPPTKSCVRCTGNFSSNPKLCKRHPPFHGTGPRVLAGDRGPSGIWLSCELPCGEVGGLGSLSAKEARQLLSGLTGL